MVSHYFKKVYKTKAATAPTRPSGSFMRDARSSGSHRSASAAAPVFKPKSRPLNWFQRHVLCMNVDIRHGQYEAYCERQNILKRLPTLPNDPPVSDPLYYDKWNEQSYTPWGEMESYLLTSAPPGSTSTSHAHVPASDEDSDLDGQYEDDDNEEEEDEDDEDEDYGSE